MKQKRFLTDLPNEILTLIIAEALPDFPSTWDAKKNRKQAFRQAIQVGGVCRLLRRVVVEELYGTCVAFLRTKNDSDRAEYRMGVSPFTLQDKKRSPDRDARDLKAYLEHRTFVKVLAVEFSFEGRPLKLRNWSNERISERSNIISGQLTSLIPQFTNLRRLILRSLNCRSVLSFGDFLVGIKLALTNCLALEEMVLNFRYSAYGDAQRFMNEAIFQPSGPFASIKRLELKVNQSTDRRLYQRADISSHDLWAIEVIGRVLSLVFQTVEILDFSMETTGYVPKKGDWTVQEWDFPRLKCLKLQPLLEDMNETVALDYISIKAEKLEKLIIGDTSPIPSDENSGA